MLGPLGLPEIIVIFLVVLLLFGARRLPEIAQGLGKGIREFKKAVKDTSSEIKGSVDVVQDQDSKNADKGNRADNSGSTDQKS
jgi:sec-independent protein translocase protein TatA